MIAPSRATRSLIHMLGSAVFMQALLSGSNLAVGLIMIRRTTDLQYGYYVLMLTAVMLMVTLQGAFIQPQLVVRLARADAAERADVVGGLYRDQRRLWPLIAGFVALVTAGLWLGHLVTASGALVAIAASVAVTFVVDREFFRMVLLGHRKPVEVLVADAVYAALLLTGAYFATMTSMPAATAALTLGFAALTGGMMCSRALHNFEPWNIRGAPGILRAIAPLGLWSAGGAGVHWLFSQGYNYLVAGMLHVPAVAAIAATRLTIMPINLLSTGIGTMMLPTAARWLNTHGAPQVLRRMLAVAFGLAVSAILYFSIIWLSRDWLFTNVLRKSFPQRDELLLMWFAVGLMMLLRDQLLYLLTVRARFQLTTSLTLASALVSFAVSYFGIIHLGVIGALVGILVGEMLNVGGLVFLSVLESRRHTEMATP
jgi:O-antigen/teichoic acid export membrane protein